MHDVFGNNLKYLIELRRYSIAEAARNVDVSRVQFNRFLRHEAFPKPAVLKRICDHFSVNARILLEDIERTGMGAFETTEKPQLAPDTNALFAYALRDADHDFEPDEFEPGLYGLWRRSFFDADKYVCLPVQISVVGTGRILRGYDTPSMHPDKTVSSTRKIREYRGVLMRHSWKSDYGILFFHSAPQLVLSLGFLTRDVATADGAFHGMIFVAREEMPARRRISRCFLEKLESSPRNLVRIAHQAPWKDATEVPHHILRAISGEIA